MKRSPKGPFFGIMAFWSGLKINSLTKVAFVTLMQVLYSVSLDQRNIPEWIGIILIPCLFYSTALTSACLASFFLISIPRFSNLGKWSYPFLMWTFIWILVFISGWNNQDGELWNNQLFLKSPFLFMPVALYALPKFSVRYIFKLHIWLLIVLIITALPILTNYIINYSDILRAMGQGHPIPTPIHHVLYSMILSYGIISTLYILISNQKLYQSFRKVLFLAISFLILFQHVLAVRTGIIILYLSIPLMLWLLFQKKKVIVISLVAITGLSIASVNLIPSLKQKLSYMRYDLAQYQAGGGGAYADSERIYSLKCGIEVWKSSPIMGVGYGDLFAEMKMAGIAKFPHSQFIYTLAGAGIIGLLLLLMGFLLPYYYYSGAFKGLLALFYLNLFICMSIDFVLEHSVIVAFLNLFGLMMLRSEE